MIMQREKKPQNQNEKSRGEMKEKAQRRKVPDDGGRKLKLSFVVKS